MWRVAPPARYDSSSPRPGAPRGCRGDDTLAALADGREVASNRSVAGLVDSAAFEPVHGVEQHTADLVVTA
jgi:hypothetical protein